MTDPGSQMPASAADPSISVSDGVRSGSPFAAGSASPRPAWIGWSQQAIAARPESLGAGVYRETATAAAYAAWMLLAFACAGYVWFPSGGIAIALLGCAMGGAGLGSRRIKQSAVALFGHGGFLLGCYFKLL